MEGLKVKCTTCGGILHETTDKYDPNKTLNGSMVRLIYPWKSWGWSAFDDETANISTTPAVLMCCPACSAPLVKNGRLTIVKDIKSRVAMNQAKMDSMIEQVEDISEQTKPILWKRMTDEEDAANIKRVIDKVLTKRHHKNDMPEKPKETNDLTCQVCGKVCKSKLGLASHMRSHKKESIDVD